MFLEVQTMRENTGNWTYSIKCRKELINTDKILKVYEVEKSDKPQGVFCIVFCADKNRDIVVDRDSFERIQLRVNK